MAWNLITALLIIAVWIIFRWRSEGEIQRKRRTIVIEALVLFILQALFGVYVKRVLEAKQRSEERLFQQKQERFMDLVSTALTGSAKGGMSLSDMKGLLEFRYREVYEAGQREAEQWVEDFLASLPEREGEIRVLSAKGREIADSLLMKWEPLYAFTLKQFDDRVLALRQRDAATAFDKQDLSLVFVDNFAGIDETIRRVTFPNGNTVSIRVVPGKIERGVVTQYPELVFVEYIKGQYSKYIFTVSFGENSFSIAPHRENKKYETLIQRQSTEGDPLLDVDFRNAIIQAINQSLSSVYLHHME